ncbi:hypothetical protein FPANT_4221 [Fusarium pseudoanthophilum]|uniref:F-box domain-containing protein n=1 Tax=Fusarium pseudoanthophilum TaxID=48495 RepID=A0A8H5PHV8_9HYPO|nr:hypothetical protein FPANT_4221 [Fusarium pseudoanthophilum]
MEGPTRLDRLPPEIFSMILRKLEPRQVKPLMQTSKTINAMAKSMFYRRMIFSRDRHFRRFLRVAKGDPRILNMIHYLDVKNVDARYFWLLLCLDLRNIESATLSNGETIIIGARDGLADFENMASLLAGRKAPKPRLKTVSYDIRGPGPRILSLDELKLFRYPSLTSLRLHHVRLDRYASELVQPLPLENLESLQIEVYNYTDEIMERLLRNAKKLKRFEFHHPMDEIDRGSPNFPRILRPCRESIKVIDLYWDCRHRGFGNRPLKFAKFTSLQYIAIPPRALFGAYLYQPDIEWLPKLREHLPPTLKVLFLQDIEIHERTPLLPPGQEYTDDYQEPWWCLIPADYNMVKTLLDYEALFPALSIIAWTSPVGTEPPWQVSEPADKIGIELKYATSRMQLEPDEEWLDELERYPATVYSDTGSEEASETGREETSEGNS